VPGLPQSHTAADVISTGDAGAHFCAYSTTTTTTAHHYTHSDTHTHA
jgi:hypothetical protein